MRTCFSFRLPATAHRTELVLFFAKEVSIDEAIRIIKFDIQSNSVPRRTYIVVPAGLQPVADQMTKERSFQDEYESLVGPVAETLCVVNFDSRGKSQIKKDVWESILHYGMLALVREHMVILRSSPNYHFLKPSGDHCDIFIRASNALTSSVEVSFLSIRLLPYLQSGIKRIYVDTSSICFLVGVAVEMAGNHGAVHPSIESFESYAAVSQRHDFVEDDSSLVIISATTSGSLATQLTERTSFSLRQIVTLFHVDLPTEQIGLFDISDALKLPVLSAKASNCSLCRADSKLVRIVGDQFIPQNPVHEHRLLRKPDLNPDRAKFIEEFGCSGVFGLNFSLLGGDGTIEHFFFDIESVLDSPGDKFSRFRSLLKRTVLRIASGNINTVVWLGDAGSRKLADAVRVILPASVSPANWVEFDDTLGRKIDEAHSVLVIAGVITSGRRLLAISRQLRGIDGSATISYLVGVSKAPEKVFKQLERDLTQGGHLLDSIQRFPMPRVKPWLRTAWESEKVFLESFIDPLATDHGNLPAALGERLESLRGVGMKEDLFLQRPNGERQILRRSFVYWDSISLRERTGDATHADVFWTIQSILYDLREQEDKQGFGNFYHCTVIAPSCFDRFNDGVIQSSILRAALPTELDYRASEDSSRLMTDIVCSVVSGWQSDQGEAALEFLMALCCSRLKLQEVHLREVASVHLEEPPEQLRFLLGEVRRSLGAEVECDARSRKV